MNTKKLIVFDYETDSSDPFTCNPVELAAKVIDPRNLEIIADSSFSVVICPDQLKKDRSQYFIDHKDTIEWHAKKQSTTTEEILNRWSGGVDEKTAWESFNTYCLKYNAKKNMWEAPIACGANIRNFDLIIADRLNKKYDIKFTFWRRDVIDVIDLAFYWFESLDEPKSYALDSLCPFLGIDNEGAHQAHTDVDICCKIIQRFMRYMRMHAKNAKFKGAFARG